MLSDEQRRKLAARLSKPTSTDNGELPANLELALRVPLATERLTAVFEALEGGRLLLPVRPHGVGEAEPSLADSLSFEGLEGGVALVALGSAKWVTDYDAEARPVPRPVQQVAAWAAAAHAGLLVRAADPVALPLGAVQALAVGGGWLTPWDDPQVLGAFERALDGGNAISALEWQPVGVKLVLTVALEPDGVRTARAEVQALSEALAKLPSVASYGGPLELRPLVANAA